MIFMIGKISDLKPGLKRACHKLGWKIKDMSSAMLEMKRTGKVCVVDSKEHTGSIFKRNLEQWIRHFYAMIISFHVRYVKLGSVIRT